MIKNKWKIEMWFRNFSYFIHKINSEFILEEYLEDLKNTDQILYVEKLNLAKLYM